MPRLHQRAWVQAAAANLLAAYVRLVDRTGRFELKADPRTVELVRQKRPFIGAFWHGRMVLIQPAWRRLVEQMAAGDALRPCVITSDHADAQLVASVMRRLDLDVALGSNKRGGLAVYRNALRVIGAGRIAVVTPDGPRGPAEEAKTGIAMLAQRSRVPIVPISFAADRVRRLKSWDSFIVPLPFARGVMAFGAPLEVAPDADLEAVRHDITRAIRQISEDTDLGLRALAPTQAV